MPSANPRRLVAYFRRSRVLVLEVLLRERRRLLQIHATIIARGCTGDWSRVLHEENGPALFRAHFMLEMRVGHIGDGAGTIELSGKTEFALDDVPDLGEIVPVQREGCARRVF